MIISQNVPICPKCKAMMCQRHQRGELFYFCHDCLSIFQVMEIGQAEIELVIESHPQEYAQNETIKPPMDILSAEN